MNNFNFIFTRNKIHGMVQIQKRERINQRIIIYNEI